MRKENLSPQCVKQLRTYAKDLCNTLEIPEKNLLNFIKASLIKYEINTHANKSNVLQETLTSKDFEISLHNCLLVCLLSLNITTYSDGHPEAHHDIFKIPASIFDDSKLKSSLHTAVSRLLATICSHLKLQKMCIVDVTKSLVHVNSGMELEAAHWNRMAFLHYCLHIFLIGTGNLKNIPINVCFMPHLIPMLKRDMQRKLEQELSIDFHDMMGRGPTAEDTSAALEVELTSTDEAHSEGFARDDATNPGLMEGLEGKPVHFNSSRFWNYIDYMLNLLHKMAHKGSSMKEEFKKGVASIMVQIFQDDLLDCPSHRKVTGLMAVNPQWQTTIQHRLTW
ncbi:hypothetical protein EDC04DRAFT_2614769 [Pisolithus marmoratus]|nr:hypothetical protein EDC04DRAFT_2614769 [Pisolithus marmoratus]